MIYSRGSCWLPASHYRHEQTGRLTPPHLLQESRLLTAAFFVAIGILASRIVANRKAPRCLPRCLDILVALKTLCGVIYIAGTVAILVYAQKETTGWLLPSAGVAAAITFVVASISEHYHSIAPSTLNSLYAIIGAVFYGYTLRGFYEIQAPSAYLYSNGAAATSLFVLIFLESKSKRSLLIPLDPPPAYESTLSFLVKPFFPHIFPLLYAGSHRRIMLSELRDIPLYLRSDPATEKLLAALAVEDKSNDRYLIKSTFRAFSSHFLGPVFPRLLVLTGTFAQVSLVEAMLLYVSDESIPKERGIQLVAGYFVVYVSLAISNYVYSEKLNAFMVLYRSALTGSLYAKTLRLTSMAARELGQGAATTYMSVDVDNATSGFQTLQDLWAAVLTIVIACTMLWYKAGYVMFAPLLFIVTLIAFTTGSGPELVAMAGADKASHLRAGSTTPIKLGVYESALEGKINALRALETAALKGYFYSIAAAATLSNVGGSASFLITLAVYAFMLSKGWGDLEPLDVSRIFTLLAIVSLLNVPLNMIGQSLPTLFAAFASLRRIQGFLQLPEKDEPESEDAVVETKSPTWSIRCTFTWDDKEKTPVWRTSRSTLHRVNFIWSSGQSPAANRASSCQFCERRHLWKGLRVNARKIALASQTAFIFPEYFARQLNILLDNAYDEVFYERVIHACALRQDIEALPARDMSKLGDRGTTSRADNARDWQLRALCTRERISYYWTTCLVRWMARLRHTVRRHITSLYAQPTYLVPSLLIPVRPGWHAERKDYGSRHTRRASPPQRDKVIVIEAGKITHFGSFEEVRDAGAAFAASNSAGDAAHSQVADKESATEATVDDEEEDEELQWTNEQASRTRAYAFYMKSTGVVRACGLFALITMWSGVGIFSTAYLSMLASSSGHLGLWIAGYGAIVATNTLLMAVTFIYFGYTLSTFTSPHIHSAEIAGVMGSPISWITKTPVGKILNRFSGDLQHVDLGFPFAFLNFSTNFLSTLGTFVFITLATPLLAFALPVLAIFGWYLLRFYLATSKQLGRIESASESPLYTLFGTTVAGLITVRAYGAQAFFRAQNAAFVNESQGAVHHLCVAQLFLRVFLLWFQTILACSAALLTDRRVRPIAGGGKDLTNETSITINEAWPSTGSLTFSDFSMKYRDELPLALKNLSFGVQGGLKIGICGRTGSGKSSTVLALFRGIDQHLVTGKIVIDGVDISTVPLHHFNLDVTNACTDSEIWETLKLVEMYDAVSALDDKLDHLVVDEESFSKGQRQLLCLARALLRKKKIIVLDDMDHITDEKIRHVVDTQMQGLTVLAIAHRISTIVDYDKIIVLDSGSIVEFDDPKVLLSNPESRFARLAATQGIYHPDLVPKDLAVKELTDGTVMVVTEDLIRHRVSVPNLLPGECRTMHSYDLMFHCRAGAGQRDPGGDVCSLLLRLAWRDRLYHIYYNNSQVPFIQVRYIPQSFRRQCTANLNTAPMEVAYVKP
ncbi:hypothetical protein B0H13DRAFT_2358376 [Mycena leptocephala]|nr:hypothetical protein B0H13DRAFT_2358376 [Mycena leptocephala]